MKNEVALDDLLTKIKYLAKKEIENNNDDLELIVADIAVTLYQTKVLNKAKRISNVIEINRTNTNPPVDTL